jgi:predicted membrane-bound spermidine synthase
MSWYFAFFFVSGFCGILYELIWMRLAMAQFGVTTALVSIVLSMFMAGLGVGSWAVGAVLRSRGQELMLPPLRLYALAELLIGASAVIVPVELAWGHRLLARMAQEVPISSGTYYLVAGTFLALTMVPWCACMGATIPLAMCAIGRDRRYEARRSFSFLYLANVLGAVAGSIVPLLLIELYGFHGTLRVGAALNTVIAISALLLSLATSSRNSRLALQVPEATARPAERHLTLLLLFSTGLATMGMELIWIRLFTPYVGPLVYSFALILATYLLSTFAGSQVYRFWSRRHDQESGLLWVSLVLLGLLPLITSDVRAPMQALLRIVLGVGPFSAVIGFLTPMLVDRWSGGDPRRAGRAYAVNVVGCIVGPLVSGFVLLPRVGEHVSMLLLALPWLAMAGRSPEVKNRNFKLAATGIVATSLAVFFLTKDFETQFPQRQVLRDSTATVIATGTGMQKQLLVNGVGMTILTPITKMMAHFTLASLDHTPRSVLVICFGMGSTFRSALSWGIPVTVVDLIPSVPKLFAYYHRDAPQILASPLAHVAIDDGRRYLERSPNRYDVIIIDPPPPVPAAGSSLLYSKEFYELIKLHLEPGGIVAQWLPEGDTEVRSSVAGALRDSFPYVRVFGSVQHWGWHFLASTRPIPERTAAELLARIPPSAVVDMMEWGPSATPELQLDSMLSQELNIGQLISLSPFTPALSDDRPINEYNRLRSPCHWCPLGIDRLRNVVYSEHLRLSNGGRATSAVP